MGLFDKLRSAIDFAENKLQNMNRNTTAPSMTQYAPPPMVNPVPVETVNDPLADETVKKYFEILCCTGWKYRQWDRYPMASTRAKRYVEHFIDGACDEEALEKAKELFALSLLNRNTEEVHKLNEYRKAAEKAGAYSMDEQKAYRKFCQEEIDAATVAYNNILDVIKDNVNYNHFSQGWFKVDCDYEIKLIVIADSFCSGNPLTQAVIKEYLIDTYTERTNNEDNRHYHFVGDDISLLVVKALHFEKHGHDRENYKTAGYEDYRNFVTTVSVYKQKIDDHPFEKEWHIEDLAKRIPKSHVFGSLYYSFKSNFFTTDREVDDYFCDAACHFLWNEIVRKGEWFNEDGEDITDTRDYNTLFNIWLNYFWQ